MDETLAVAAIDLGGRPHAVVDLKVTVARVGDLQTELVHDFFEGFAIGARANVHVKVLYGRSSHHKIEAVFKAFARALRVACAKDERLARCCRARRGCCDRAHRLRRRQPDVGAKALAALGADVVRAGGAGRARDGARRSSCPASATSARRARSIGAWIDAILARVGDGRAAARHLPRHAVAVRRQRRSAGAARPRPARRALLSAARPQRASRTARSRFRTSAGTALDDPARRRRSSTASPTGAQVYFTHSYVAPVTGDTVAVTEHGEPFAAVVAARPRRRRAVPSGEVGRRRAADPAQLPRASRWPTALADAALNASSPASTSATARSSRASTSRGCARAGDPAELARRYNAEGIDELVILDITATLEARRALADTIRAVARELFIPLAVGGGIRTEDDAAAAVDAGADKVSLNTAALAESGADHDARRALRQPGGGRRDRRQARRRSLRGLRAQRPRPTPAATRSSGRAKPRRAAPARSC